MVSNTGEAAVATRVVEQMAIHQATVEASENQGVAGLPNAKASMQGWIYTGHNHGCTVTPAQADTPSIRCQNYNDARKQAAAQSPTLASGVPRRRIVRRSAANFGMRTAAAIPSHRKLGRGTRLAEVGAMRR